MPQRFLRPEIRTSARWNETSLLGQSLFISILTLVDDFGRYDGRSTLLHGECFILRNGVKPQQTAAALQELHDRELIQLYEADGKTCLKVERWKERTRSEKSKFPDPPPRSAAQSCGILPPKSSPSPSPSPVPIAIASTQLRWSEAEGWSGDLDSLFSELRNAYPACDIPRQFLEMEQWLKANPTQAHKSNWRRFVDNWLRRKQDKGGDVQSQQPKNGRKPFITIQERQKKHGALTEQRNALFKRKEAEDREFTPAEQARYDALTEERDALSI